ncbi:MAG: sulfotransferase, partial [Chloroflexota bacterium]|nr:sulfotransferase [Chloroflexota bacterium]
MEKGPVFIGGLERTGTSLLYALLASHPNMAMTRRTNWWTFFYGNFGDLARDENLERCLGTMMRYRRHLQLDPDPERLRREFLAG